MKTRNSKPMKRTSKVTESKLKKPEVNKLKTGKPAGRKPVVKRAAAAKPEVKKAQKPQRPTPMEVSAEAQLLIRMQPNIRETTFFGDNNWDAINAQIAVLSDHMSEDLIFDAYSEETLGDEFKQNIIDSALDAWSWMTGAGASKPSDEWKELVGR